MVLFTGKRKNGGVFSLNVRYPTVAIIFILPLLVVQLRMSVTLSSLLDSWSPMLDWNDTIGASNSKSNSNSNSSSSSSGNNISAIIPNKSNDAGQATEPMNVLLYITTVFSDQHQRYLKCCWPPLLSQSRLFQDVQPFLRNENASTIGLNSNIDDTNNISSRSSNGKRKIITHVIIFSNNITSLDEGYLESVRDIFMNGQLSIGSFQFKFADGTPELEVLNAMQKHKVPGFGNTLRGLFGKQWGANMAMSIGFHKGWFAPFDWVIRINPDVLIRDSTVLWDHFHNPNIDAIVALCGRFINTDFFAIRPKAVSKLASALFQNSSKPSLAFNDTHNANVATSLDVSKRILFGDDNPAARDYAASSAKISPDTPFSIMKGQGNAPNHEYTAKYYLGPLVEAKRTFQVPKLDPMKGMCRIRGQRAPIIHDHDSCVNDGNKKMICNGLLGWNVQ